MTEIANTGERILLEKETPLMIARHRCAYKFAEDYVCGRTVLEIGCGEGYGSYYLAGFAREVDAIDYDKHIIDYAKTKYPRSNLHFYAIEARDISSLDNKFDTVCSFQFIEHIQDTQTLLEDLRRLLKDKGIFICSTPNRRDASPNSEVPLNRFHIKEYLLEEFKTLLRPYFPDTEMYGLKRGRRLNFYRRLKKTGICNLLPESINPVKKFYNQISCEDFVIARDNLETALDFIAVCRK